jgi:hypothetical protein
VRWKSVPTAAITCRVPACLQDLLLDAFVDADIRVMLASRPTVKGHAGLVAGSG